MSMKTSATETKATKMERAMYSHFKKVLAPSLCDVKMSRGAEKRG